MDGWTDYNAGEWDDAARFVAERHWEYRPNPDALPPCMTASTFDGITLNREQFDADARGWLYKWSLEKRWRQLPPTDRDTVG